MIWLEMCPNVLSGQWGICSAHGDISSLWNTLSGQLAKCDQSTRLRSSQTQETIPTTCSWGIRPHHAEFGFGASGSNVGSRSGQADILLGCPQMRLAPRCWSIQVRPQTNPSFSSSVFYFMLILDIEEVGRSCFGWLMIGTFAYWIWRVAFWSLLIKAIATWGPTNQHKDESPCLAFTLEVESYAKKFQI